MDQKKRENWIDCLKLIAMLIVVMNHAGFTLPGISFLGGLFFVPVFFVLSGFTFQLGEVPLLGAAGKKAKRLLVPYFTANGLLFLFFFFKDVVMGHTKTVAEGLAGLFGIFYGRNQIFAFEHATLISPGAQENYFLMTNLNSPTWFLPALFLTLLFYEAAARVLREDEKKLWLLAMVLLLIAVLYHYLSPVLLMWSLDAIAFFFLFFLVGAACRKHRLLEWADSHKWVIFAGLALLAVSACCNGSVNFSIGAYGKSVMLALLNAVLSSVLMMYLLWKVRDHIPDVLGMAGRQTLFILCYHLLVLALLEAIVPGLPVFVRILLTIVLLAGVGMGKDAVIAAWKERRGGHAER